MTKTPKSQQDFPASRKTLDITEPALLSDACQAATYLSDSFDSAFPLLHRALTLILIRRAFDAARQTDTPTETLSFWHKLLLENSKLTPQGTPAAGTPQGPELMEIIWDIFGLPEDEKARRRAQAATQGARA